MDRYEEVEEDKKVEDDEADSSPVQIYEQDSDSGYSVSSIDDFQQTSIKAGNVLRFPQRSDIVRKGKELYEAKSTKTLAPKSCFKKQPFKKTGRIEIDENNQLMTTQSNKLAVDNWKRLKSKVIQHIRMKRMADNLLDLRDHDEKDEDEEAYSRLDKFMISPENKKLQYFNHFFNLLVLLDTAYIIQLIFNYRQSGLNFQDLYLIIFSIDFFLNFFKMYYEDVKLVRRAKRIGIHYLKNQAIFDLVALIPYQFFYPSLCYLKFARFYRFLSAINQLIDFTEDLCFHYISWIRKKTVMNWGQVVWLLLILGYICHFLASAWVYIGMLTLGQGSGWISKLKKENLVTDDYSTQYIAAIYYIFASLSTVGYGDVTGVENEEIIFQMVVIIIGIGFFAYFMGNLNNLISSFSNQTPTSTQVYLKFIADCFKEDGLEQWLIQLDKAYKSKILEQEIFTRIMIFFKHFSTKDLQSLKVSPMFKQLKPRLQKQLADTIFIEFYQMFETVFEGTEEDFRRKIFQNMSFKLFQKVRPAKTKTDNLIMYDSHQPKIFEKSEMPSYVYFIIKGEVFFTNESGAFHYFKLSAGSYFGDINALFNFPSSYSAFFDEEEEPVQVLAIKREKFCKICDQFPISKEAMLSRAIVRRRRFRKSKIKSLAKLMKALVKTHERNICFAETDQNYLQRQQKIIKVYQTLLDHFNLIKLKFKQQRKKAAAIAATAEFEEMKDHSESKIYESDQSKEQSKDKKPPKIQRYSTFKPQDTKEMTKTQQSTTEERVQPVQLSLENPISNKIRPNQEIRDKDLTNQKSQFSVYKQDTFTQKINLRQELQKNLQQQSPSHRRNNDYSRRLSGFPKMSDPLDATKKRKLSDLSDLKTKINNLLEDDENLEFQQDQEEQKRNISISISSSQTEECKKQNENESDFNDGYSSMNSMEYTIMTARGLISPATNEIPAERRNNVQYDNNNNQQQQQQQHSINEQYLKENEIQTFHHHQTNEGESIQTKRRGTSYKNSNISKAQASKEQIHNEIKKQEQKIQDMLTMDLPFDIRKNEIVSEYLQNSEDEQKQKQNEQTQNEYKDRLKKYWDELTQDMEEMKKKQQEFQYKLMNRFDILQMPPNGKGNKNPISQWECAWQPTRALANSRYYQLQYLIIRDKGQLDDINTKKPQIILKQELLELLNVDSAHYFQIFTSYRFQNSFQKSIRQKERQRQLEEDKKIFEAQVSISVKNHNDLKSELNHITAIGNTKDKISEMAVTEEDVREENMIAASWLNDLGNNQKEFDDKIVFFNNETILQKQHLLEHFSKEHLGVYFDKHIEFQCKKGRGQSQNQDNFFTVLDGDFKIFGVFDGHGIYGHIVSGFAAGIMLDYIRNKNPIFSQKHIDNMSDKKVSVALKRCFRYTQDNLKEQYKQYLAEQRAFKKNDRLFKNNINQALDLEEVEEVKSKDYSHRSKQPPYFQESDEDLFEDSDENQEDLCTESSWDTSSDVDEDEDNFDDDDLKNSSCDDSDDSQKIDEQEVQQYQAMMMALEQINSEQMNLPEKENQQNFETNTAPNLLLMPEKSDHKMFPRKIIRLNQKQHYQNPLKEIQEKTLREKIKRQTEETKKFDIALSGTTATLVIQTPTKLYMAWVGDSNAVLGRNDKKVTAIKLTVPEHTPQEENEKIRIYNHRGEVRTSVQDKKTRIYVRARMYPGISTSRSLGDLLAHHIGVSSEPNIKIMEINGSDKFIVMGTDGIWDNMGPEDVIEVVKDYGIRDPGLSCDMVCSKVKDICLSDNTPMDDMTIIISHLHSGNNPYK